MTEDKQYKYFRVNMDKSFEDSINKLFEEKPDIADLYSNDSREFVKDAIRRLVFYYKMKKHLGDDSQI